MNRHRKMRMAAGKSLSELVDALKPTYPKVCKAALSFAENSASTGVTLTSEADAVYKALCEPKRDAPQSAGESVRAAHGADE